jgi:hypothetical protein
MASMSNIDAYFAGLIDGEGCLSVDKRGAARPNSRVPRITVNMTNREIIELLHATYGGSFRVLSAPTNPKHKQQWRWRVQHKKAREMLTRIYPHLRVKKPEADAMILHFSTERRRGRPPKAIPA